MAKSYVPGLKVSRQTRWRVRRLLPIPGNVLVNVGDHVSASQVVARTEMPGDALPLPVARELGCPPGDLPKSMKRQVGDTIKPGDVLAETKGMFGWFPSSYASGVTGTIESISPVTGQVLVRGEPLRVEVVAYLSGVVEEVIPEQGVVIAAMASVVQGILGIGGEAFGEIAIACDAADQPLTLERLKPEHKGKIVIGGGRITGQAVRRGVELGVAALVSGGIDDADLKEILGFDLGVAITGTERIGCTVIVTEGFGDIAMARRTFELFRSLAGKQAACNGATQIRAGVLRPEVLVPLPEVPLTTAAGTEPSSAGGFLTIGAPVRIIRDPEFGVLGKVEDLPFQPQLLESGAKARVLVVKLDDGRSLTVPRANVELVES